MYLGVNEGACMRLHFYATPKLGAKRSVLLASHVFEEYSAIGPVWCLSNAYLRYTPVLSQR